MDAMPIEAIYVRQSKDKKDSISIESQIDFCKRQCTNPERAHVYADKGFSGKNTQRPDFQRLMCDVEERKVSKIVIYRLDRLSRSIVDFSRIWEKLQYNRVEFVSVNEKFDTTTPMGKAMIYIIMIFAQLERETIGERVRDNYYTRIRYGSWPGGPAPYGFRNAKTINAEGKHVPTLVESEEIHVVEQIFELYAQQDISLGKLAARLTEEGILCTKRKSWDNVALARILHSPVYVQADERVYLYYHGKGMRNFSNGREEFDGTRAAHIVGKRDGNTRKYKDCTDQVLSLTNFPGKISSDIWLRCQYKLEKNRQIGNAGKGKHSWLSGVIKCKACGYSLSVVCNGDRRYFACSGRRNLHICSKKSFVIHPAEIEQMVAQRLNILLGSLHDTVDLRQSDSMDSTELQRIEKRIQTLIEALSQANDISMEYINRELARLDRKKQEIIELMRPIQRETCAFSRICFDALLFDEKKLVVCTFIEKIVIGDDEVEIVWK